MSKVYKTQEGEEMKKKRTITSVANRCNQMNDYYAKIELTKFLKEIERDILLIKGQHFINSEHIERVFSEHYKKGGYVRKKAKQKLKEIKLILKK